jgi:hypothetical protein
MNRARSFFRDDAGQSVVLFSLLCFAMALAVISMFALGSAYRDKMTAQGAADAAAYSLAVQEARTLNYFALTNRTSIAHEVAMMSVYGHASFMTYYRAAVQASRNLWLANTISASTCCGCCIPPACVVCCLEPCCFLRGGPSAPCCTHIKPFYNNYKLYKAELSRLDSIGWKPDGNLDKALNIPAMANSAEVSAIVFGEQTKMNLTLESLLLNQSMADQIAAHFESQPNAGDRVHAPSAMALTGAPVNKGPGNLGMWATSVKAPILERDGVPGYVMASLSARPDQSQVFITHRTGISPYCGIYPIKLFTECGGLSLNASPPQLHVNINTGWKGESKTMPDTTGDSGNTATLDGNESAVGAYRVAAHDAHGTVRSFAIIGANGDYMPQCLAWASAPGLIGTSIKVYIHSRPLTKTGADHNWKYGSDANPDTDHPVGGCSGGGNDCGVYTRSAWFRTTTSSDSSDYQWYVQHPTQNMPRALALITRDFNGPFQKNSQRPWELCGPNQGCQIWTPAGVANFDVRAEAKLQAPITGLAMGLAYYHRTDDWKEIPNLLNPFWRAKLHKMSAGEGDDSQCKNSTKDNGMCWTSVLGGVTSATGIADQATVMSALPIPF